MDVDIPARVIGGLGVVIAAFAVILNWYLWRRSGPEISVTAFVRTIGGTLRIEVRSTGRMPVTVRRVEVRDEFVLKTRGGASGATETEPFSRWSMEASVVGPLPVELSPSSFIEADMGLQAILDKADGASEINVRAWAQRGDGKWYSSAVVRLS